MKFNYTTELKKFRKWQEEQAEILKASGMPEEDIEKIQTEDWKDFKAERVFCRHNFSIDSLMFANDEMADEEESPLMKRNTEKMTFRDVYLKSCKEDWLLGIEDEKLYKALKTLDLNQLDLAYSIYECNMTLNDYAIREGVSISAISQRHNIILKKIKKFYKMP